MADPVKGKPGVDGAYEADIAYEALKAKLSAVYIEPVAKEAV